MREEQNIEHNLGEIKEKCPDQPFRTFHSSCHSSLLSDVCINACYCSIKSDYFVTYSPCLCFRMQIRKYTEHCRSALLPLHLRPVRFLPLLYAHPLHHHICDRTGTKELSASFLLRDNAVCSLVLKPRHKVYS